ncbi:MAG TPA: hypothetical protein VGF89_11390 [Steroidobacteraceae bacterium]
MKRRHTARQAGACTLAVVLLELPGFASADTTTYQQMAPLAQYLMPPDSEIALARSAAPAAISGKATVMTLNSQGYQTSIRGSNGFTCLVERSWMSPFDSPDFWNPKIRGPVCYNPAASESILTYTVRRTKLALAGDSREMILGEVRAALARKELPSPAPGAMSFMMSKDGYLSDADGHWHSHLMFHLPKAPGASWGANLPGSPVVVDDREVPEPETIFMVPVSRWSDGTTAMAH